MTLVKCFLKYSIFLAISGIIAYTPVEGDLIPHHTEGTLSNLQNESNITTRFLKDFMVCYLCKSTVGDFLELAKDGKSDKEFLDKMSKLCSRLSFKFNQGLCQDIMNVYSSDAIYILRNLRMSAKEVCNYALGEKCGGDIFNENNDWIVKLSLKPKSSKPEHPVPKENAPFLKVLHISDTHYDPFYQEGSNANCKLPLCCRASSGELANLEDRAGKWGDYRKCNTPKRTMDSVLDHIVETHKDIDYILWTGDMVTHDIWNQSKSTNLQIIRESVRHMTEKFPGIPIFPVVGNHESVPMGSFPPPNVDDPKVSIDWLYNELETLWKRWLPESALKTVREGAYYSVLLHPGLRIISLNSNYCYHMNIWLLLDSIDPANQLRWLVRELQKAEDSNEKVQIIGHIPPGHSDCLVAWSRNFYQIVERYEHTIVGQFYGHTHLDEFEVFYDPNDLNHATSVAYIGPSVSTYEDLNPGYRIYYVDGDHDETTRSIIDHETWIMDLREANQQEVDEPVWYKLYSARAAYGMKALRPNDWKDLIDEMSSNRDVFEKYHKHYWKDSPLRPPCSEKCRKDLICDAKSGRSYDRKRLCQE